MVRLRRSGTKLPREDARAATPVRGDLTVSVRRGVRQATIIPTEKHAEFLHLEQCSLTQMRGDSFLIVGLEADGHRADAQVYEQAWWCRLPAGAQLTTAQMLDLAPEPTREERRHARAARS